jgi:hypothetical protein
MIYIQLNPAPSIISEPIDAACSNPSPAITEVKERRVKEK